MLIKWFRDIEKEDFSNIGEKAVNIFQLQESGLPVPHGFILSTDFYDLFLEETSIKSKLEELKDINISDEELLQEKILEMQELILEAEMPFNIKKQIIEAYENLNVNLDIYKIANKSTISMIKAGRDLPYTAVRTSLNNNSIFENPATFLNVKGNNNIILTIQKCYASILTRNFVSDFNNITKIKPAIIIQKMINSQVSGIATTDNSSITIKAALGMAESIHTNIIEPDFYTIGKDTLNILNRSVNEQKVMLTKDDFTGRTIKKFLNDPRSYSQKLLDYDIQNIAKLALKIESLFNSNMEIEFAIENSKIYILQAKLLLKTEDINPKNENNKEINPQDILDENPVIANSDILNNEDVKDYYSSLESNNENTLQDYKDTENTKHLPIKISTGKEELSWVIKHEPDWDVIETVLKSLKERWKQNKGN